MATLGIDIGTFHTASAVFDRGVWQYSLPSLPGKPRAFVVPSHATSSPFRAGRHVPDDVEPDIVAPKLHLGRTDEPATAAFLRRVVGELVSQITDAAVLPTHGNLDQAVVTVPPGWSQTQCAAIREALPKLRVRFLHEPIALILAVRDICTAARNKSERARNLAGTLLGARPCVICDWGAGTVDIACILVRQARHDSFAAGTNRLQYDCVFEQTVERSGGHHIALYAAGNDPTIAYRLEKAWAGISVYGFDHASYGDRAKVARASCVQPVVDACKTAARSATKVTKEKPIFILYGGPLESPELREMVTANLSEDPEDVFHISGDFVTEIASQAERQFQVSKASRESLIAMGAAKFGSCGSPEPEFAYEVDLRDAAMQRHATTTLAKRDGLEGVTVVRPPYTGVDYHVDVRQLRPGGETQRLALHVRSGAAVEYRIAHVDIGRVKIVAAEAHDSPVPRRLPDARFGEVEFEERSTRFAVTEGD